MECLTGHAHDGGLRGLHIFEDHFLPEIIDPATGTPLPLGEEGELVFTTITKQGMPVLRYRTGDVCALLPDPCPCGRTLVRMTQIKGRVDDMLIIRGINVYPSEVERVLLSLPELAPHYQILIAREHTLDVATVQAEVAPHFLAQIGEEVLDEHSWNAHSQVLALQQKVSGALHDALGLHVEIRLQVPGTLPRSEGKAVRVLDQRQKV